MNQPPDVPPWERPDAFPPRPAHELYGFLAGGKMRACSRERLIERCRANEIPAVYLVWTPESDRLVPPFEVPFLREALVDRGKEYLGIQLFQSAFMIVLWVVLLFVESSGWPLFLVLLVVSGIIPVFRLIKAWRGVGSTVDVAQLVRRSRYEHWVAARSKVGTWTMLSALTVVGAFELFETMRELSINVPIQRAALLKGAALESEPWRLATGPMIHGGAFHFLFNVLALLGVAILAEALASTAALGLVFLTAMIAGSLASAQFFDITSVGASGGILGITGFLVVVGAFHKKTLPVPLHQSLIRWVAAIGLAGAVAPNQIDNAAHAGGFIAGVLVGLALVRRGGKLPIQTGIIPRVLGWSALLATVACAAGAVLAMSSSTQ